MDKSIALSSITDSHAFWDEGDDLGAEEAVAPTLYGRSQYQKRLLEAYEKVTTTQESQIVFVHGISGSGKTALIDCTLREKVCAEGQGYFCSGKFFQNSGVQEPYSAIMSAFSDLCDLVIQSPHFKGTFSRNIRKEFISKPEEVNLLGRMVNLTPFLGHETAFTHRQSMRQLSTRQLSSSQTSTRQLSTSHRSTWQLGSNYPSTMHLSSNCSSTSRQLSCSRQQSVKQLGCSRQQSVKQLSSRSTTSTNTGNDMTFTKFKSACKMFLQIMASDPHNPVLLFIDDIQWMDEGSRLLIEMLLKDKSLQNIMLILAYRDEEAEKVEKLLTSDSLDVQVRNLELAGVHEMVCATLGEPTSDQYHKLSGLVLSRTGGNPFFVMQFLDAIIGDGLMAQTEDGSWEFDVAEIQREIMVSNSLADLLHRKIGHLSQDMKTMLTVASIFGFCFDEPTMIQVATDVMETTSCKEDTDDVDSCAQASTEDTINSCLSEAIKAGFVERLDEFSYQFTHDKLQTAFLSFSDELQTTRIHFLIGEAFMARSAEDPTMVYNAAVHFNDAISCFDGTERRDELARINLDAALYCKDMIAFDKAAELLKFGLELLDPETRWSKDIFELTFEMTEELANMELAAGRFEECKQATEALLFRGKSKEMKINAFLLSVECRMAANDIAGSTVAAKRALEALGVVRIPKKVSKRHVVPKLLKVKRQMSKKTDDDILGLPIIRDRFVAVTVRLLSHVFMHSLLRDDEDNAIYATLLAMELTLLHGLSPYSSVALTIFGVSELSFGNHDRAYRYGKLAMMLLERCGSNDAEASTVGLATTFLLHWKQPLSELRDPLSLAAMNGLERGENIYGAFCFWQCIFMDTLLGQRLDSLFGTLNVQYHRAGSSDRQSVLKGWIQPNLQFMANHQSHSTDWDQLALMEGEYMHEAQYIQQAKESNYTLLVFCVHWTRAQLAYDFGFYGTAEKKYKQLLRMGSAAHLAFSSVPWFWWAATIHYEQYRALGKRANLRKARRSKRKLEKMEAIGCPNVSPALTYLGVKELTFLDRLGDASVLAAEFDRAIESLDQYVYFKGMASQDAAFTFARMRNREHADRFFKQAMDIYLYEWGSMAKYQWLQEQSIEAMAGMPDTGIIEGPACLVGGFISCDDGSNSDGGESEH